MALSEGAVQVAGSALPGARAANPGFSATSVNVQGMMVCNVRSAIDEFSGAVHNAGTVAEPAGNCLLRSPSAPLAAVNCPQANIAHTAAIIDFTLMTALSFHGSIHPCGISGAARQFDTTAITGSTYRRRLIAEIEIKRCSPH